MIHIVKLDLPFKCVYPIQVLASIEWPAKVDHNGTTYCRTAKGGVSATTNIPCAEYSTDRDQRLWLMADGRIEED